MRVLFLYCERFGLETYRPGNAGADAAGGRLDVDDALVCLVHSEEGDGPKTVTKLIKNAKWICGKFDSRRVVLHFFAHLGEDPGDPELARSLLDAARERLEGAGYEAAVTPFGWFCRLDFGVHGESLAKVFKVL